eukprot:490558-Pyramimonas_sp.AAC.1
MIAQVGPSRRSASRSSLFRSATTWTGVGSRARVVEDALTVAQLLTRSREAREVVAESWEPMGEEGVE